MKNILIYHHTNKLGGAERSMLFILERLDRQRFNPIVALPQKGRMSEILERNGTRTVYIKVPAFVTNVSTEQLRHNPFLLFKSFILSLGVIKQLLKHVRVSKISLIYTHSIKCHIIAGIAGRIAGMKTVWHLRDILPDGYLSKTFRFLSIFLPNKIITISNAVSKSVGYTRKSALLRNCIDLQKFNPEINSTSLRNDFGITGKNTVISHISRIASYKGQRCFIRSAKLIILKYPYAKFLIVGDALFHKDKGEREKLEELAKELGLSQNIIFTGNREDIPEILSITDILVINPSYQEPSGRIALEGLAMKKPIVATNVGGLPEIVKDKETGLLVEPENPDMLADAIIKLIDDKNLAETLSTNGRKFVETICNTTEFINDIQKILDE